MTKQPIDPAKIFETSDLDFGAFLMLEGIQYLGCRVDYDSMKRKPLALMKFADEKLNVRDLERIFMTSREKRYRDLTKYLLKEVHKAVKSFYPMTAERKD